MTPQEILNSDDTFIQFILKSKSVFDSLATERKELENSLEILTKSWVKLFLKCSEKRFLQMQV